MATLIDDQEAVRVETSIEGGVQMLCERLSAKLLVALESGVDEVKSVAEQLATNAKVFGAVVVENVPLTAAPPEKPSENSKSASTGRKQ